MEELIHKCDWIFIAQDFRITIMEAKKDDLIYCDPPYIGRHTNYFDIWTEKDEYDLYKLLSHFEGKFILSTWYRDKRKENEYVKKLWNKFKIITKSHFYYVGGKEINRNPVVEALITNFNLS